MKQYLNVLKDIIENGVEKESGRANMPNTVGLSSATIKMDMADGFPLLTTKKMFTRGIIHELLWFLRGDTNIKYLVDNNVNIWNGDAYRWYLKTYDENHWQHDKLSMEDFIKAIRKNRNDLKINGVGDYKLGDLGKVYGYQWRNQNGVDQVADVINGLQTNPYSRYHIIDAWNKADFVDMALPPCHLLYQFIVRPLTATQREDYVAKIEGLSDEERLGMNPNMTDDEVNKLYDKEGIPKFYLDVNMYQRSCDIMLGVPFNIASMSFLLHIVAKTCNMIPGIANWLGGDTHAYVNHIEQVKEQLSRNPKSLPFLIIKKELKSLDDILNLRTDDFEIIGYDSHPAIKAKLSTGL